MSVGDALAGTREADWASLQPARTVHFTGISIMRIADSVFVEAWQNWDMLGVIEQIKGVGISGTYISAA